uniref:BMA-MUP-4 n=2 Tax=Brugia TaxID=6278 RepID=A0A1I9G8U2_BRUMA|nr:BMA-MUP-4 [Brugia malayi]
MVGGATHCVCKKGTIRPQGSPRCVLEPLLQQYLNNIIGNCTEIQKDLIEVYGEKISFSNDSPRLTYARKETECDPKSKIPCKGYGEICLPDLSGRHRCTCANNGTRMDSICLVNECMSPELNDCDPNASCMDSILSYECFCNEGFIDTSISPKTRPGIKCAKLVDECASKAANQCDENADCIDKPIGYTCRCRNGYVDISEGGARNPGRKCHKLMDECQMGLADCDPKAICIDMTYSYTCKCPHGFADKSADPINKPGRICSKLINSCDSPNFTGCQSKESKCIGTKDGFVCRCIDGYIDLNPANPGTNCSKAGMILVLLL